MKRKSTSPSKLKSDPALEGLYRELIIKAAHAVAQNGMDQLANEKVQRKFRSAVISILTRMEARLANVQAIQLLDFWNQGRASEGRTLEEFVQKVEERTEKASERRGIAFIKYMYAKPGELKERRDRRKKWSGWEI